MTVQRYIVERPRYPGPGIVLYVGQVVERPSLYLPPEGEPPQNDVQRYVEQAIADGALVPHPADSQAETAAPAPRRGRRKKSA